MAKRAKHAKKEPQKGSKLPKGKSSKEVRVRTTYDKLHRLNYMGILTSLFPEILKGKFTKVKHRKGVNGLITRAIWLFTKGPRTRYRFAVIERLRSDYKFVSTNDVLTHVGQLFSGSRVSTLKRAKVVKTTRCDNAEIRATAKPPTGGQISVSSWTDSVSDDNRFGRFYDDMSYWD